MSDSESLVQKLKDSQSESFFQNLEKFIGFKIPKIVVNILIINSYDSAIAISKFDESGIPEMEEFMRNDFNAHMMNDGEHLKDYLGIYWTIQKTFKFVSGQLKIIQVIVDACNRLYCDEPQQPPYRTTVTQDITSERHAVKSVVDDQQVTMFNLIGSHMITVFNYAKRVTLSAWSWPARQVTAEMSHNFKHTGSSSSTFNFQYLVLGNHTEFLNCIVKADIEHVKLCIRESLAISLRLDGSVDGTQDHNVFVMTHIVKKNGTILTLFIGFGVPKDDGATYYLQCLKDVADNILTWEEFFLLVTFVVTDGENLNTGRLNSLCARLKEERRLSGSNLPLFSIWCIAHRINLAWKSACKIDIVAYIIVVTRKLAKYFRTSGKRTRKLKDAAARNHFARPLRYPKYFAIRWCEYLFNLFTVVLRNWRASIEYFESEELTIFLNRWLSYDTIHLLTFLTDILSVVKTFQKLLQSDSICMLDVIQIKQDLIEKLEICENNVVEGGWEELFLEKVDNNDDSISFFGHALNKKSSHQKHAFTNYKRNRIIRSLIQQLKLRFGIDSTLENSMKPLANINSLVMHHDLKLCHSFIIPDLDEGRFLTEYYAAGELLKEYEFKTALATLQKLIEIAPDELQTIKHALARILAAKPHSADVERLISVYNKFKDSDRSSLNPKTLNNYLYINTNMSTVEEFNPTSAVNYWMLQKNRRVKISDKSREQEWFDGVFHEAATTEHRKHHPVTKF